MLMHKYDKETQEWLEKNLEQRAAFSALLEKCEKCGLFFKPSLGHKCRKEEKGMTNYEKNKELLDMYAASGIFWGVDKDGKISGCSGYFNEDCDGCIFYRRGNCRRERFKWLQQEYKESEVDWSKVPIDTPILVRNGEDYEWEKEYFTGFIHGKICTFGDGDTSKNFDCMLSWDCAKLDEEDEEE